MLLTEKAQRYARAIRYAALPPMGVTIYGRPQGVPAGNATLNLKVHHPSGAASYTANLWEDGDAIAHRFTTSGDQTDRGALADWVDENQEHMQAIPPEFRRYLGQLIRRGHRWPPEPPVDETAPPTETNQLSRRASAVRRYAMTHNAYRSEDALAIAGGAARGDNTSLGALADKLEELGHPAGPIVRKAYESTIQPNGVVEGDSNAQSGLALMHGTKNRKGETPSYHPVLPHGGTPKEGHAAVDLAYLKIPSGHWWNLQFWGKDGVHRRSFLIPTTPEEVEDHIAQLRGSSQDYAAKNLEGVSGAPVRNEPYYEERLRAAGIHPDQLNPPPNLEEGPQEVNENIADVPPAGPPQGFRRRAEAVRRYSMSEHQQFQDAINKNPLDMTTRGVYADYLEENEPNVDPKLLEMLRNHNGHIWIDHTPFGVAGAPVKRITWQQMKRRHGQYSAAPAEGQGEDRWPANFFTDPRYAGGKNAEWVPHGKPYSGPGGHYFVTVNPADDKHYKVWEYHPDGAIEDFGEEFPAWRSPSDVGDRKVEAHRRAFELASRPSRIGTQAGITPEEDAPYLQGGDPLTALPPPPSLPPPASPPPPPAPPPGPKKPKPVTLNDLTRPRFARIAKAVRRYASADPDDVPQHNPPPPQYQPYAWPGGYPLVHHHEGSGSTFCADCANAFAVNNPDEPPLLSEPHYEGPPIYCDDCGTEIESAYGDPDEDGTGPGHPNYTGGPNQPGGVDYARRAQFVRRYAAWRAPAGGMIARGVYYEGGKMVPDMQGEFMNPPQKPLKLDHKKVARVRSKFKPKVKRIKATPSEQASFGVPTNYARMAKAVRKYTKDDPRIKEPPPAAPPPEPELPPYDDNDRRLWVLNHEPLYHLWQSTLGDEVDRDEADPLEDGFIENHRDEIDNHIRQQPGMENYPARYACGSEAMPVKYAQTVRRYAESYEMSHLLNDRAGGRTGEETKDDLGDGITHYRDRYGSHRFVLHIDGKPVSAVQVISRENGKGRVVGAHTDSNHRRKGYAKRLINTARSVIGDLEFDTDRSDLGTKLVESSERKSRNHDVAKRYAEAGQTDLRGLFRAARSDPYEPTRHAVIADALDEAYPGNKIADLIRKQFGFGQYGGQGERNNLWYEPVENSWDGTFPYAARLGQHGPFDLYLRHEGNENQNPRWVLHAVSRMGGSRDFGYSFEFPHEEAGQLRSLFDNELKPHMGTDEELERWARRNGSDPAIGRNHEANSFDNRMDEEERNRG